ncbi:transposable element Tcb2 transposase [Trichonephila clavipes]|nr:transposable element Tcb2 transposase [Trichonephila clavipes]
MLSSRPGAIYQQDNARPHTARLSQQCLQGYDVLPWPARSPDLSPIEHNRFLETESAGRIPGQGRRRATTPNEERFLVLTAQRHRNMNATLLQQHLRSATGTTVSTQTVQNRLHGVGLYARRPMAYVLD